MAAENEFYDLVDACSYYERFMHTPKNGKRGKWTGIRGESVFVPCDSHIISILHEYGLKGIRYSRCVPDFSSCAVISIEINKMSANRNRNFRECDEKCAGLFNEAGYCGCYNWTRDAVCKLRKEKGLTWHERNDRRTCDMVKTEINRYFGHLGGVSECKHHGSHDSCIWNPG